MIIVDTTTLVEVVLPDQALSARARSALMRDPHWAAPAHQPLEFLSSIRGLTLGSRITPAVATAALDEFRACRIEHFAVLGDMELMDRMWELRHNITPHDAAHVALAEALDTTVLTADVKLATASGPRCRFQSIR
ncbi:type II toxin-antitoxin system VapC family toxin [Haloactinomyces albus]|uniref:Ribonuclease VapC n=1 Tax=Haloactinomyces albus TaxID=1352928 RepID=A0AAE4CLU7_9ACTN|nr:type II toxin-antitoxin system VapC family toxin [Haloactinomyces albus]MDR7302590.1 putative nucleic acid-binding protein [Haloactinomyces albus]